MTNCISSTNVSAHLQSPPCHIEATARQLQLSADALVTTIRFDCGIPFKTMYKTGAKRFCEHCNEYVSPATFKKLKANFYDFEKREWISQQTCKRMDTEMDTL